MPAGLQKPRTYHSISFEHDEEGSDGGANDFESGDEGGSNDEFDTPVAAPIGKPPAQVDDDAEGGSEKERDSEKDDGNSGDQGDQAMMGNEMAQGRLRPFMKTLRMMPHLQLTWARLRMEASRIAMMMKLEASQRRL